MSLNPDFEGLSDSKVQFSVFSAALSVEVGFHWQSKNMYFWNLGWTAPLNNKEISQESQLADDFLVATLVEETS